MDLLINNTQSFKAKYVDRGSIRDIVEYAAQRGKYDKLKQSAKNTDTTFLKERIRVDIQTNDKGMPVVIFTRYNPRSKAGVALTNEDFHLSNQVEMVSQKEKNPLKYAMNLMIKMGNNVPHNRLFRRVVAAPQMSLAKVPVAMKKINETKAHI